MDHQTAVAIVCARNEQWHIGRCVRDFIEEGIDVVLIDNDSTDDTVEIAQSFLGKGLLSIHRLPWHGFFSLDDQLKVKNNILAGLPHDWVIHADADEWLQAPSSHERLLDAIQIASMQGFNALNFSEFVFVPNNGEDFTRIDYKASMLSYYFFEPSRPRLMRAWRREANATNLHSGGHILDSSGGINLFPKDLILRHYIMLSHEQGVAKYVGRKFNKDETDRGWHFNRLNISADDLMLKDSPYIRCLDYWDSKEFDTSNPATRHFWEW